MSYHNSPASLHYLVKLLCSKIVNYIVGLLQSVMVKEF